MNDSVNEPDFDTMSDEDFLKMESPAPAAESIMGHSGSETLEDKLSQVADEPAAVVDDAEVAAETPAAVAPVVDHTTPNQTKAPAETVKVADPLGGPATEGVTPAADSGAGVTPAAAVTPPAEAAAPIDFEKAYNQVMAPFKANGRDFTPSSPEEAIRLMQMGANYTKKMQALTPNLKLMRMLDNNGLLEENKINYLIDLNRKDPGAIQQLLVDSKIDPLDLNLTPEKAYKPSNHAVSDQDMVFHEHLGDVMSAPGGKETVQFINTQWDRASKEAVYKEPAILGIIHEQRANGIFDRISAEIDRQKTLGNLTNIPFITAYQQVGDTLHAKGLLTPAGSSAQPNISPAAVAPRVLETRTEAPKARVSNDAAARAASPARAAPPSAPASFDPFTMSDAEIMAHQSSRV